MAATATQQIIHNGKKNLVLHYTVGGSTGDTTNGVLVDISALDPDLPADGLRLIRAHWSLIGFQFLISWGADTNVDILEFGIGEGDHDFTSIGGIPNNGGAGVTGDVLWTTNGYSASGDVAHLTLEFKKRYGVA